MRQNAAPVRSGSDIPQTRATLIQRLRLNQDSRAWQEFAAHYRGYMLRLARRMGLRHHDAEEVVQNVCLKAWRALPTFDYDPGKGRFRGWLWRITANEVRQYRRQRRPEAPGNNDPQEVLGNLPDEQPRPEDAWVEEEWRAHVAGVAWQNIRGEFQERTRQVFEQVSRGLAVPAVAAAFDISPASVYVYRKRVQDRLRDEIRRLNDILD